MENNEFELRSKLAAKIATITAALGKFIKDGHNEQQRYYFVSYEQINARLREMLLEHKLMMIPSFDKVSERDMPTKSGGLTTRSTVEGKMTIVDIETGYLITGGLIGADNDGSGKSIGKAITEAVKRYEMKLFHISTQDDADPDASTPDAAAGPDAPRQGYQQYPQQQGQPQGQGWM